MEKVLNSIKNLYKGDNILKRHLFFSLLLLLPALSAGVIGVIDKDTPQKVMIIMAIIGLVLLCLSIIPYIFLLGFYIKFVKDRLADVVGIPQINGETFISGIKVLPLCIMWCIYCMIFFGAIFIGPLVPIIIGAAASKPDYGVILGGVLLLLAALAICFAAVILVMPFVSYVLIEYVDKGKALGKLFNPFILIGYMKKAFKDTIFVELKFIIVSIIASIITGIAALIVVLFAILIGGFAVLSVPESQADVAIYSPVALTALVLLSSVASIVQIYVSSMVSYAATENYINVYKEKITEEVISE